MKTEYKGVLFPFSIFRIGIFVISIFLLSCKGSPKQNEATAAQNAVESIQGCKCYDGIGASKNDAPKLTYTFENNKTVIVCGFADDNMHAQGTIVSEFNVFDCDTGESYVEYGATKICRIQEKQNELEIQFLKYLPVGKDWVWELIQIGQQTIKPDGDKLKVSILEPKVQVYQIDKKQADEFLNSLKPGEGLNSDWEQIIAKLEALSIIGNERAWKILRELDGFTGVIFDGALSETWGKSIENVKWIRGLK